MNKPVKVEITPSTRKYKKYMAMFSNRNGDIIDTIHFGDNRYEDYTIHKDKKRRARYIDRHKHEDWNDPMKAGTLSRFILWDAEDIKQNVANYKRRFKLL